MRHSRTEKAATHSKIVAVAAKRFRELGLEGIGVADVMKEAGSSVGGFYKHFESRDELVIEAGRRLSRILRDGSRRRKTCLHCCASTWEKSTATALERVAR